MESVISGHSEAPRVLGGVEAPSQSGVRVVSHALGPCRRFTEGADYRVKLIRQGMGTVLPLGQAQRKGWPGGRTPEGQDTGRGHPAWGQAWAYRGLCRWLWRPVLLGLGQALLDSPLEAACAPPGAAARVATSQKHARQSRDYRWTHRSTGKGGLATLQATISFYRWGSGAGCKCS